jgi:hypothetical protein
VAEGLHIFREMNFFSREGVAGLFPEISSGSRVYSLKKKEPTTVRPYRLQPPWTEPFVWKAQLATYIDSCQVDCRLLEGASSGTPSLASSAMPLLHQAPEEGGPTAACKYEQL